MEPERLVPKEQVTATSFDFGQPNYVELVIIRACLSIEVPEASNLEVLEPGKCM